MKGGSREAVRGRIGLPALLDFQIGDGHEVVFGGEVDLLELPLQESIHDLGRLPAGLIQGRLVGNDHQVVPGLEPGRVGKPHRAPTRGGVASSASGWGRMEGWASPSPVRWTLWAGGPTPVAPPTSPSGAAWLQCCHCSALSTGAGDTTDARDSLDGEATADGR